jgi:hypothetical protein
MIRITGVIPCKALNNTSLSAYASALLKQTIAEHLRAIQVVGVHTGPRSDYPHCADVNPEVLANAALLTASTPTYPILATYRNQRIDSK